MSPSGVFTGHTTMWMAVFADIGTSLLVVFNGYACYLSDSTLIAGNVSGNNY